MWGTDDVLFFAGRDGGLGRISNGRLDVLLAPGQTASGLQITGLWGRSATEVFVALNDEPGYRDYACGGDFMIWFDGSQFHQF
jgi:hypothetical protein